jgi:hypothetical protein
MTDSQKVGVALTQDQQFDATIAEEQKFSLGMGLVQTTGTDFQAFLDRNTAGVYAQNEIVGGSILNIIAGLKSMGWSDFADADGVLKVLSSYRWGASNQQVKLILPPTLGGPQAYVLSAQDPELYIDPRDGFLESATPNVPEPWAYHIGDEYTCLPVPLQTAVKVTTALHALHPEWTWGPSPTEGMISLDYMNMALVVRYGDSRDSMIFLLEETPDYLTRFDGVIMVADALNSNAVAVSAAAGIPFATSDYMSSMPLDPASKQYVMASMNSAFPRFPTFGYVSWVMMLNKINPFGLVDPKNPNIVGVCTPDWNGAAKCSVLGVNQLYDIYVAQGFPACVAAYVIAGGWKYVDVTSLTVASQSLGTLFGALLLAWTNPDGSYSYPMVVNQDDWSNMQALLDNGTVTKQQLANVVEYGIRSDPALRSMLFDAPIQDVLQAFLEMPNMAVMMDAWKSVQPTPTLLHHPRYAKKYPNVYQNFKGKGFAAA